MATPLAQAEGSQEFDTRDDPGGLGSLSDDQPLQPDTALYVDVLVPGGDPELICWQGVGNLEVFRPGDDPDVDGGMVVLTPGTCSAALDEAGEYPVRLFAAQTLGTEWDIRVCAGDDELDCLTQDSSERLGRLWSTAWHFSSDSWAATRANNGSVFAVVPGGADGRDAVIEMSMDGVSGRDYRLFANSGGPETSAGRRVGRSALEADHQVDAEFPIYLNPPEKAGYNWIAPEISDAEVAPSCGTGVILDRSPGTIGFRSNIEGQYVVVCDLNGDDVYDFASRSDFSAVGKAEKGLNTVEWDGKNNAGANVRPDDYRCVVHLNVGEFHYVAEDIETSFPGFRLYRVDADRTRAAVAMFWDDRDLPPDVDPMQNGETSAVAPGPDGLDPGPIEDPALPFYYDNGEPVGNARAWGTFDVDAGKGNNAFLDTFAAADSTTSAPLIVRVVAKGADSDGDGLSDVRECAIGSDPDDTDTDGDGVRDGFEASATSAPDSDADGTPDVLDDDDDGDGVPTAEEGADPNGDGDPGDALNSDGADDGPDYLDDDSDDDGVADGPESAGSGDLDANGVPDEREPEVYPADSDGDGIPDYVERPNGEAIDSDADGTPDYMDDDDDNDSVPTAQERPDGQDRDSDGDGVPDHLDTDDDADGIPTAREVEDGLQFGSDVDGDQLPNYLDTDSDGDGSSDRRESVKDRNHDGIPDYLHANKPPALAGGALCAVSRPGSPAADGELALLWLAPAALLIARRRSRRAHMGHER